MTRLRRWLPVFGLTSVLLCAACSHSVSHGTSTAAGMAAPDRNAAAASAATDPAGGRPAAATPLLAGQLIRTAQLTVAVRGASAIGTQADAADAIAERAGGEIDSDDRSAGSDPVATLQLRVPPKQLQQVLHELAGLGVERSRSSSTRDVTERVADVTSRVRSAQDSLARLRTLYGRATRVADVIAIESQLTDRESDLESLEAQQRALSRQTALATVTVHLLVAAPRPQHHHPAPPRAGGFVGGVQRGWHAFATAAVAVSAAFGALLPFLALVAVLGLLARLLGLRLPRVVHRRTTPPTD